MAKNLIVNVNRRFRLCGRSEPIGIMVSELAMEGCVEITRILPDWDSKETFVEYNTTQIPSGFSLTEKDNETKRIFN